MPEADEGQDAPVEDEGVSAAGPARSPGRRPQVRSRLAAAAFDALPSEAAVLDRDGVSARWGYGPRRWRRYRSGAAR